MSGEDEVDDYMSDSFVVEDVRPGLPMTYAKKRIHDLKKTQSKVPKLSELESSTREEGLNKALDSSNKGFAMLAKMGFKPGSALGKTPSGGGLKEPIGISLKSSRKGLGTEAHLAQKKASTQKAVLEDFQARVRTQSKTRYVEADLRKSQKAAFDLDFQNDVRDPLESWFWPPKPEEDLLEESEDDEEESKDEAEDKEPLDPGEMLDTLTAYLRTKYHYCIWCGDKFKDDDEMKEHCPGDSRDLHDEDDF
uniref:G patch domain-containing protein 11 n=1 Tax=Caligus rogercresseyi TaxID=217165 RepID=C1BMW1_CALRO|nr:Coiled-coil domain-containing protein 75 [Caligus rogercresseyi]